MNYPTLQVASTVHWTKCHEDTGEARLPFADDFAEGNASSQDPLLVHVRPWPTSFGVEIHWVHIPPRRLFQRNIGFVGAE